MNRLSRKSNGFTLLEVMIAMLVTLIVLGGALQLFTQSMRTSDLTVQRSEVQTEVRAALNQIERDLSQAGTGVPQGGIPIPSAASLGTDPNFACDISTCYLVADAPFTQGSLYSVTPGNAIGPNITGGPIPSDAIKITYVDPNVNWSAYLTSTITAAGTNVTMPAGTTPAVNDTAVGISPGDAVLLQNSNGSAVGMATSVSATAIAFAASDPLNINQSTAPTGNIAAIATKGPPVSYPLTKVSRLVMITYFLQAVVPVVAADGPDSRLMRQEGAHPPVPVAEHIEELQITYDIIDSTGVLVANLPNAVTGTPPASAPNQIRKININITGRSFRAGLKNQVQRVNLSTSIGPRNLSFRDRYQ
jgi:prepilin-type N-terminal cleavage/methylation domain-containing protein